MVPDEQRILLSHHVPALSLGTSTEVAMVSLYLIIPLSGGKKEGIDKVIMKDTYPDIHRG
jgi:hypothetical protein